MLERPITREKQYKYKGQMRTRLIVERTEKKPISVQALAKSINNYFWYRRKVSEGTKGPIEYEFTKRRITLSRSLSDNSGLQEFRPLKIVAG